MNFSAEHVQAYATPLVGVWTSGVSSPQHPLVWLACLNFYASSQLKDKASQGDQAFLLLLYASGQTLVSAPLSVLHCHIIGITCKLSCAALTLLQMVRFLAVPIQLTPCSRASQVVDDPE